MSRDFNAPKIRLPEDYFENLVKEVCATYKDGAGINLFDGHLVLTENQHLVWCNLLFGSVSVIDSHKTFFQYNRLSFFVLIGCYTK